MQFVTPSKNVGPNLKPYYERFLSEFYENGNQKLPSTRNDWEICSWSWCKNLFWETHSFVKISGIWQNSGIWKKISLFWKNSGIWKKSHYFEKWVGYEKISHWFIKISEYLAIF